jgi:two-component system osmolarity sensor histidine kinase EnvZ
MNLYAAFPNDVTDIYLGKGERDLVVFVDTDKGLFQFETSRKKIFSSSIFMFVAWMAGTSILLFLVAVLFLRIQVRSIAELAQVAEEFGKGIDNKNFKPYGSSEVRKAAIAFIKMKERIQRQISERTQMLAGYRMTCARR